MAMSAPIVMNKYLNYWHLVILAWWIQSGSCLCWWHINGRDWTWWHRLWYVILKKLKWLKKLLLHVHVCDFATQFLTHLTSMLQSSLRKCFSCRPSVRTDQKREMLWLYHKPILFILYILLCKDSKLCCYIWIAFKQSEMTKS